MADLGVDHPAARTPIGNTSTSLVLEREPEPDHQPGAGSRDRRRRPEDRHIGIEEITEPVSTTPCCDGPKGNSKCERNGEAEHEARTRWAAGGGDQLARQGEAATKTS